MTVTYAVTLEIEGQGSVDIGDQLNSLTVQSGSSDGFSMPSPSICNISFLGSPSLGTLDLTPAWWLGRNIGIKVTPSDSTVEAVFYGKVYSVNAVPVDAACTLAQIDLSLMSPAAEYTNYLLTQDQAVQAELTRLQSWFQDAEDIAWEEVGNNLSWDEVDIAKTWANYYLAAVPGLSYSIYGYNPNVLAYTANSTSLADALQGYVLGNGGWISETVDTHPTTGRVTFNSYFQDQAMFTFPAGEALDITTCALFNELSINAQLLDIYNYVEATNGTDISSYEVPSSVASHGYRPLFMESTYVSSIDMDTIVSQKAIGRSEPTPSLSNLVIDYDICPASNRAWFGGVPRSYDFSGVPAMFGGDQLYWLMGTNLSVSYEHAEASWTVVPRETLAYFDTWENTNYTDTWNTYATALTKWQDLT